MSGGAAVLAMDGVAVLGTLGFFVPAAIVLALVAGAVVRDRRLSAAEEPETPEPGPEIERISPPRGE